MLVQYSHHNQFEKMAKLSKRLFLILTISYVINQFGVNSQSTNNVTPNGQSSNLTFSSILSYTSQPSITSNQTLLSLFTSSSPNNANIMMTTVTINTSLPYSRTRINRTRSVPQTTAYMTTSNSTRITRFPLIILTPFNRTIHVTTIPTVTLPNFATKCEQYITLLISLHFLLFIFPIH